MELINRPRRLRTNEGIRGMVRETRISKDGLIYPMFVRDGSNIKEEITSMEGQYRYSIDRLGPALEDLMKTGVNRILLFGIPDHKDPEGSGAWAADGIVQKALEFAKKEFPDLYIITDVCMCEYTSHGHCGILDGEYVDNDKTLEKLSQIALSHVQAGADMVAPSDMMDGRIAAIRSTLDKNNYVKAPIMSYAVKYSSAFYEPFREAAGSAPAFGNRKSYQMDYHNKKEALKEAALDVAEGADILIVKPALSYLDIINEVSGKCSLPVAAYSVSGEYAMIKAAAKAGFIDERAIVCEMTAGIFRAGANILITYYAKDLSSWIKEGRIG